ncbi:MULTISPECIES: carbohydrate ABC transporter permease [Paenibacillus]|jgi:putative aldouronate transport system permease protein|uniref:Binding-protein-dependent transport system inner membrane protein n=1 Tax=Paenibacillus amylolyticus TaxID=1451 RepID=A0A100VTN2_PAEAM|nr:MULTISPECIES: carbohydrate ABC transporter permease [Paenibacillus]KAA8747863.1 carbohydrate ABC transporter permease [Paenibacillus sp. UASWS1643]MBD8841519.1 carbohydrate ABC transporter permease [Paenibacillus sp. CFBP 13594]MDQ0724520.1 putative aldouronate transport system permease protein [Paenibacillus sp. W4I10]MDR6719753.1 putative aldouronate transport system permease protein [Paenibacillus sp. 2003]MDT9720747.1 carbohydrate ABC transporter permease [Paenibacillus sp. ClWae2A]
MAQAGLVKKRDFHHVSSGWNVIMNIIAGLFALICVFPFIFVVIISFTDEKALARDGYRLIPAEWSLAAYQFVWQSGDTLLRAYGVTILVTVLGTIISLILMSLYAYAISRKSFRYRRFFSIFAILTMLFNGGMIPTYMVVSQLLGLKDTLWALILPLAMNAFYIMILRTFYSTSVPDAVIESAKIDGAGEFYTFMKIVIPLSLPGLATIGLFSTLGYWNDWFNALLYIDNPNLVPLQSMLMRIESSIQFIQQNSANSSMSLAAMQSIPQDTSRMAMVVLATLPIIFAYPFFQRYFVQGLTVGAVKE